MEGAEEGLQSSGASKPGSSSSGGGRSPPRLPLESVRTAISLGYDESKAKSSNPKPGEGLVWRGRARIFSMGVPTREASRDRPSGSAKVKIMSVNVEKEVNADETSMMGSTRALNRIGVGHTSAQLENAYFRRLCGADEQSNAGSMTTNRDRQDGARDGHTSLASVVTQRYKAQVGVDWTPHSPRHPSTSNNHASTRTPQARSSAEPIVLAHGPSVSVIVESFENGRSSNASSSNRSPRLTHASPRPFSIVSASENASTTSSHLEEHALTPHKLENADFLQRGPKLQTARISSSSPVLSASRSSTRRSSFQSRSLSSPYFNSWCYGNIDVSHMLRINQHQTAKQLIRARLQAKQTALFAKTPHFVQQSPNSVLLGQLAQTSREDALALSRALSSTLYRKELVVERNDVGKIILAGDSRFLVLALFDDYFNMVDHLEVILYTHAAWIPREMLLKHLTELYKSGLESFPEFLNMAASYGSEAKEAVSTKGIHQAIKTRVLEILHTWIETCPTDFSKSSRAPVSLHQSLESFLFSIMESNEGSEYNAAELVISTLNLAVRTVKGGYHGRVASTPVPAPKISLKQTDPKLICALDIPPAVLTAQLAIRDFKILKSLTAAHLVVSRPTYSIRSARSLLNETFEEIINASSDALTAAKSEENETERKSSKRASASSDPVSKALQSTQKFVGWVITEVVTSPNLNARIILLGNFIDVAHRCYELRNYHSTHAIHMALSSAPVARLNDTWKALSSEHTYLWSKIGSRLSNLVDFFDECVAAPSPKVMPLLPSLQLLGQQHATGDRRGRRHFKSANSSSPHGVVEVSMSTSNTSTNATQNTTDKCVNFAKYRGLAQILKPLLSAHHHHSTGYPFSDLSSSIVLSFLDSHLTHLKYEQLWTCSKNIEHGPIASNWNNGADSSAEEDDDISIDSQSSEEERAGASSSSNPSQLRDGHRRQKNIEIVPPNARPRSSAVAAPLPLFKLKPTSSSETHGMSSEAGSSHSMSGDESLGLKPKRNRPRSHMVSSGEVSAALLGIETSSVKSSGATSVASGSSISTSSSSTSSTYGSTPSSRGSSTNIVSKNLHVSSPASTSVNTEDVTREKALKDLQNEVRSKWTRPWTQCSVGADLPRFVRKMVVVNEMNGEIIFAGGGDRESALAENSQKFSPSGASSANATGSNSPHSPSQHHVSTFELIPELLRSFAIALDSKKDAKAMDKSLDLYFPPSSSQTNLNTSTGIDASRSQNNQSNQSHHGSGNAKESGGGDIAKETDRFCREILGEHSKVSSLLKVTASQGIVAPAWMKLRLFILSRFGFKDVKRGWLIAVSFNESRVTVVHRRREASNEETTGVPNFEFSWEFSMVFNKKMEKLEHASFSIVNMNVSPHLPERNLATLRATIQDWFLPGTDAFPCLSLFPAATLPIITNAISLQNPWINASGSSSMSSSSRDKKDKKRKSLGTRTREFLLSRQPKSQSNTHVVVPVQELQGPHVSIADTYVDMEIPSTPTKGGKRILKTFKSNDSSNSTQTVEAQGSVDSGGSNPNEEHNRYSDVSAMEKVRPTLVRRLSDSSSEFAADTRRKKTFGEDDAPVPKNSSKGKGGDHSDTEVTKSHSKSEIRKLRRSGEVTGSGSNLQVSSGNAVSSAVSFKDQSGDTDAGGSIAGSPSPSITLKRKKRGSISEVKVRSKSRSKSSGSANSAPTLESKTGHMNSGGLNSPQNSLNSNNLTSNLTNLSLNPQHQQQNQNQQQHHHYGSTDDMVSTEDDDDEGLEDSDKSMSWSTDSSWSSLDSRGSTPSSTNTRKSSLSNSKGRARAMSTESEGRSGPKNRKTIRQQGSTGSLTTPSTSIQAHSSPMLTSTAPLPNPLLSHGGGSFHSLSSFNLGGSGIITPTSSLNSSSASVGLGLASPKASPAIPRRKSIDLRISSPVLSTHSSASSFGSHALSSNTSDRPQTPGRKKSISSSSKDASLGISSPALSRKEKRKSEHSSRKDAVE